MSCMPNVLPDSESQEAFSRKRARWRYLRKQAVPKAGGGCSLPLLCGALACTHTHPTPETQTISSAMSPFTQRWSPRVSKGTKTETAKEIHGAINPCTSQINPPMQVATGVAGPDFEGQHRRLIPPSFWGGRQERKPLPI